MSRSDATLFFIQYLKARLSRNWPEMHSNSLCKLKGLQQTKATLPLPWAVPISWWSMEGSKRELTREQLWLRANSRREEEKWDGNMAQSCPGKVGLTS